MGYGIDVGSTALKVVALRRTLKGFKAVGASRRRIGGGDPKGRQLRALLEALGTAQGPRAGVVGLSGRDLNLQLLQQPAMKPANYRVMMGYELDQRRGEATDLYIDYCTLREPDAFTPQYLALIGIGKRAYVDERIELAARGRVDVRDAVPNPFALYAAYRNAYEPEGSTILLLDLGSDNMDLAFVRGGRLIFARNLAQGARIFDNQISSVWDGQGPDPETLKVTRGTLAPVEGEESEEASALRGLVRSAAGQLVGFINSALNHARMQLNDKELVIDKVMISGGGSRLKGLADYLAGALKVPVEPLDPFRNVDLSPLEAGVRDEVATLPTDMAIATGLAQLVTPTPETAGSVLSILPESLKKRRNFFRKTFWLAAGGVVLLLALVAQAGMLWLKKGAEQAALADYLSKTSEARKKIDEMDRFEKDQRDSAARAEVLLGHLAPGRVVLETVMRLRRALPPEVRVREVRLADGSQKKSDRDGAERLRAAFTVRRRGLVTGEVESETERELRIKGQAEPFKDEDIIDGIRDGVVRWTSATRTVVVVGDIDESIRGGAREALNALRDQLSDASRGVKASIQNQRASDKPGWRQFEIVIAGE